MGIEIQKQNDTLFVKVRGEFDLQIADCCRREIDQRLKARGIKNILFDLEGLTFIDSSGIGVILGRYRKVKESGGKVVIVNAPPKVLRILELSGLTRLIPLYDDVSGALKTICLREEEF